MKNTFTKLIALAVAMLITTPLYGQIDFNDLLIVDDNSSLVGAVKDYSIVDLDDDGDLDFIFAGFFYGHNSGYGWYENDGNENFIPHVIDNNVDEALSISSGDLDGDGDQDLVVGVAGTKSVNWYKNDGNQVFALFNIETEVDYPIDVIVYDLDQDGDQDVLSAATRDDEIAWYMNDGSGSFTTEVISSEINGVWSVLAVDVNGDGNIDILTSSQLDDKIVWFENDGEQNFGSELLIAYANEPVFLSTTDFEGDGGFIDIVAVLSFGQSVQGYYYDEGQQKYNSKSVVPFIQGGTSASLKDMDNDGDIDVVVSSDRTDEVTWHENDGEQNFTEHLVTNNVYVPKLVVAIDINGDEKVDVVMIGREPDELLWYKNDGAQSFMRSGISTNINSVSSMETADLDNDGDQDIVVTSQRNDRVVLYENTDQVNHEFYPVTVTLDVKNVDFTRVGDINNDGKKDIVSYSSWQGLLDWHENLGNNQFRRHQISDGSRANDSNTISLADIDNDNDLDILAGGSSHQVNWYDNNGDGTFRLDTVIAIVEDMRSVLAVDMDNDGHLDILTSSHRKNTIAWYRNDGNQVFSQNIIDQHISGAIYSTAIDIDNDGDMDVLACSEYDDGVRLYKNNGDMTFVTSTVVGNLAGTQWVSAQDMDGDDDLDLIVTSIKINTNIGTFKWYENNGNEVFTAHSIGSISGRPDAFVADDIDGDGDNDILFASGGLAKVTLFENNLLHVGNETISSFTSFALSQNYPNPFAGVSTISYTLPAVSNVQLVIYNQLGQKVMTMVNAVQAGGTYEFSWDGKDQNGVSLASGVYLYRLETNNFVETRKMILVR